MVGVGKVVCGMGMRAQRACTRQRRASAWCWAPRMPRRTIRIEPYAAAAAEPCGNVRGSLPEARLLHPGSGSARKQNRSYNKDVH